MSELIEPRQFVIRANQRLPQSVQADLLDLFDETAARFESNGVTNPRLADWLAWAEVWGELEFRYDLAALRAAACDIKRDRLFGRAAA